MLGEEVLAGFEKVFQEVFDLEAKNIYSKIYITLSQVKR